MQILMEIQPVRPFGPPTPFLGGDFVHGVALNH